MDDSVPKDSGDLVCAGISSSYLELNLGLYINDFFLRGFLGPLNLTSPSSSSAIYFCIFV